jgi:hypothetical protein
MRAPGCPFLNVERHICGQREQPLNFVAIYCRIRLHFVWLRLTLLSVNYAVGKRRRTIGLERQTAKSALLEFRVNYEEFKYRDIDKAICSEDFATGGHLWRVNVYPSGEDAFWWW